MQTSLLTKTATVIAVLAIGTVMVSEYSSPAYSNVAGAPTGKTGSPGDASNCTGCHAGAAITTAGLITTNIPTAGYTPGTTYTITGTISASGINKFGFEISPQNTTGVLKGTMVVTNVTETKLIGTGKYITHKSAGTAGVGMRTWSFDWIAPPAGTGNVTFYGAFVAANGNTLNTGDQVTLSSILVSENTTIGIDEHTVNNTNWTIYPNPAQHQLLCEGVDVNDRIIALSVFDVTGKLIKIITNEKFTQTKSLDIIDLQSGMYVLSIVSEKGTTNKTFIKN
jgi:Secretion system C-terminal sorting domain